MESTGGLGVLGSFMKTKSIFWVLFLRNVHQFAFAILILFPRYHRIRFLIDVTPALGTSRHLMDKRNVD